MHSGQNAWSCICERFFSMMFVALYILYSTCHRVVFDIRVCSIKHESGKGGGGGADRRRWSV